MISKKKEEVFKRVEELNSERLKLQKQHGRSSEDSLDSSSLHPAILVGQDLREFAKALRIKNIEYKKRKTVIQRAQTERGVLQRTEKLIRESFDYIFFSRRFTYFF